MSGDQISLEEKFTTSVDIVQNLPKNGPVTTSNDEKLMFYGLFKQATIGPCNTPKPGLFSVVERYKWDAWKKNGDMSKEEAMQNYVDNLLEKINEVEKNYDTKQWLTGELFETMAPKFAIIGKHYKTNEEEPKHEDVEKKEERSFSPYEHATTTSVFSDTEYCDAIENDDQLLRSRSSSYELQDSPRPREHNDLKVYCSRAEAELRTISEQIEKLSKAVEQRHSSLLNVFKKATVYIYVPKGVSWTMVFLFFLWPVIANLLMRYLRRWLIVRLR